MGIVDEDVERVKAASDLVAIVGEHLALRRVGRNYKGLCPFHNEHTPSFNVNPATGRYKCFGCGVGGDVITFVREVHGLDFVGAVEWLAARAGITLRYDTTAESGRQRRRARLIEVLEAAAAFYHQRLLTSPDAGPARAYLRRRGLDGELVRRFRIGWAPEAWDELVRSLDASAADLIDAGLAFRNRRGGLTDVFRGRIMFPIGDLAGEVIGFGGRILPGAEGPKYKNTAQTAVYDKSRALYGIADAKAAAVNAGEIVVCEGYTDVIGCHRVGITHAVATCGTALTSDHVRLLRRFAPRLVLAFDADAAGRDAAARAHSWEQELDLEVAVARLPEGVDPGDLADRDPGALVAAVKEAVPLLAFRLEQVLAAADTSTPERRARAADAALAVIADHPSNLVRREYAGEVAARLGLPVDELVRAAERRVRRAPAAVRRPDRTPAIPAVERLALAAAVQDPGIAGMLDPVLFRHPLARAAAELVAEAGAAALSSATGPVADVLERAAVEEVAPGGPEVVARLVVTAARSALDRLRAEAAAAEDPLAYAPLVAWVKHRCEAVMDPGERDGAVADLIDWLVEEAGADPGGAPGGAGEPAGEGGRPPGATGAAAVRAPDDARVAGEGVR